MTPTNRERNEARQHPPLPSERRVAVDPAIWLGNGTASGPAGVVWLKRPMPDGQWPVDQRLPRDDSFSWWIRSHCGHEGGAKQWAFYKETDADTYEGVFRDNPCRWTQCPDFMIQNDRRKHRG